MAASHIFGRGLGERKLREIIEKYPTIMKDDLTKDEIIENVLEVQGFSDISATKFANHLNDFKKFYKVIGKEFKLKKPAKNIKKEKDDIFEGQTFVFTGFRDSVLENFIAANGGKVSTSVSGKTTLVVYSGKPGGKLDKAKSLGVATITKEAFEMEYM
jgi:DNA ligase (NAD+)